MGYVAIVKLPLSCQSKKSTRDAGKMLCESHLMKQLRHFEPFVYTFHFRKTLGFQTFKSLEIFWG